MGQTMTRDATEAFDPMAVDLEAVIARVERYAAGADSDAQFELSRGLSGSAELSMQRAADIRHLLTRTRALEAECRRLRHEAGELTPADVRSLQAVAGQPVGVIEASAAVHGRKAMIGGGQS